MGDIRLKRLQKRHKAAQKIPVGQAGVAGEKDIKRQKWHHSPKPGNITKADCLNLCKK
jgi:hypothetical protein